MESDDNSRNTDLDVKTRMKKNADRKAQAQVSDLKIGGTVLLSHRKKSKFSTRFYLSPFQETWIKGTTVTEIRNAHYVTHNSSQFKKIISDMVELELPDDDSLDVWENDNKDINPPQGNLQLNAFPLNSPQPVCNRHYPVRIKCPVLCYGFK